VGGRKASTIKPVSLPSYLTFFEGQSRLRSSHLDSLSLVSSLQPRTNLYSTRTSSHLAKTFFYRTHIKWNDLPLCLREINCPDKFKVELNLHLWKNALSDPDVSVDSDSA